MELLTAIVQAVGVIFACWAIVSGVDAWKREFVGKRKIELAEAVLSKFFEVKDAVAFIRNPFSTGEEGKSRKREASESDTEAECLNRGYVVVERYQKREAVFAEFNTLKYRFMASFGQETEPIFDDTFRAVNSIFTSARILATHYWKRQDRPPADERKFQDFIDQTTRHEGVFWDENTDEDVIRKKLQAVQVSLEAATAPCFKEPVSLLTRWVKWVK